MAQKKAFVRYAANKAVPGSLIVRTKAPKVGTWKEVPYDVCCNNCKPYLNNEGLVNPLSFIAILCYNATTPCSICEEPSVYNIVCCYDKLFLFTNSGEKAEDGYYYNGPTGVSYQVVNGEFTFNQQCA